MPSNTNEKIEPVRAFAIINSSNKIDLNMVFNKSEDAYPIGTENRVEVLITPVLTNQPHELSGNSGELNQTKETPSELIKAIEDWQKDCRPMTPEEREVTNKFFWSHFKEPDVQSENSRLKSQLEDYRQALESVRENKWRLYFDWDNTCWRCNEWKGLTPLSAIQSAMSKEGESRNE